VLGFLSLAASVALADWIATDSDDLDEVDANKDQIVGLLEDADEHGVEALAAHVSHDRNLLRTSATKARTVASESDPILAALVGALAAIVDHDGVRVNLPRVAH
jgi:hypothetical protein